MFWCSRQPVLQFPVLVVRQITGDVASEGRGFEGIPSCSWVSVQGVLDGVNPWFETVLPIRSPTYLLSHFLSGSLFFEQRKNLSLRKKEKSRRP